MKKILFIFLFTIFSIITGYSQQTIIKGSVNNAVSNEPILGVTVTLEGTNFSTLTNELGVFQFDTNVPLGEQMLNLSKDGYSTNRYPIVVNEGKTIDITDMSLEIDRSDAPDLFTITLSDDELNDDTSGADNISGLLSSSRDVFSRTVAFEFSSSFFRVKGMDSNNSSVLINGIEMNKMYNGRPQWSNWGGLNDVVRNQELTTGLTPSAYNFGGVLGTTNINVRASQYREGGRLTYSSSNRSYINRLMASYSSGLMENGWAYTIMAGRRWGNEGYQDATLYDSNSFFVSIEKKIGNNHSLNFTSIYAPNHRGKSSAVTQEVYDLKGIKYNEYWGWQNGEKRNSRIKKVEEPIIMLNHYWDINPKTTLNTNIGYQFGEFGNSRLDYAGGINPSPIYYKNLPSYFLEDGDLAGAYDAEQRFINGGQIDWNRIYDANITNSNNGLGAAYALYEDRSDNKQLIINTILNSELTENITLNASVNYKTLKSENFAEIIDLFNNTIGYLDNDQYAEIPGTEANNLQNPNRYVFEGDKFKYHYNLFADVISGYAQGLFKYNKIDFYLSGSYTNTQYQREGLYQNGKFPDNSLGKGNKLKFNSLGAKGGVTYKITGKHLIDINAGYIQRAPTLRNVYTSSRENHNYVGNVGNLINVDDDVERLLNAVDLTEEKITSFDVSYIFRSPIVRAKLTGFYTTIQDANEVSFFFSQGSNRVGFMQETLVGVDKKHFGGELGIEAQVTPTIRLKGGVSAGQYTYDNNPILYQTTSSSDFLTDEGSSAAIPFIGTAKIKDYKVAAGPQQAYSFGFEYRDPDYWWFGATANYFSNAYLDFAPIIRTDYFYLDQDGLPFNDYDETIAKDLLKQEEFDDYVIVNLVGGKSWKIDNYYIGFFASINNVLDKEYKTGGYEQGRRSDYRTLRNDVNLPIRQFGPKYWYGRGTNYFLNVYFRF